MRLFISIFLCLVLCQCATQHETREFPAFFRATPPGYLNTSHIYERRALEMKAPLSAWDSRRLLELYEVELRQVKKGGARHRALEVAIQKLEPSAREVSEPVQAIKDALKATRRAEGRDTPKPFRDPDFKRGYFEAHGLWNRDENEAALIKAQALLAQFGSRVSTEEKLRGLDLVFRVALDVPDLNAARGAYLQMRSADDCAPQTADAGFLIALTELGAGNGEAASATLQTQCDPDTSPSGLLKRQYWLGRARETAGQDPTAQYRAITTKGVPGYYSILAHGRLNQPLVAQNPSRRSYLKQPIAVAASVKHLWDQAEKSLEHGLRFDAAAYLSKALEWFGDEPQARDVPALLYTAHLFQAAGLQIEAFKVYATVTEVAQSGAWPNEFDFLTEMFPAPYADAVDAVCAKWGVDPDFAYAIMRQESAFNPGAVSSANARGLMQLMPFLAEQIARGWGYDTYYTRQSLFFARENLKLATYHLKQLQGQLNHPALMAAAYNAGTRRVGNWIRRGAGLPLDVFVELIPVGETRNYVKLVLRNYAYYKLLRAGGTLAPDAIQFQLPDPAAMAL